MDTKRKKVDTRNIVGMNSSRVIVTFGNVSVSWLVSTHSSHLNCSCTHLVVGIHIHTMEKRKRNHTIWRLMHIQMLVEIDSINF